MPVEVFLREALWTKFGLTLEAAWALWPPGHFRDVMKFLEIQSAIESEKSGASAANADVTQAAFEQLQRERDEREQQNGGAGVHDRDGDDPSAAGGG